MRFNYLLIVILLLVISSCCKPVEDIQISGHINNLSDSSVYAQQNIQVMYDICTSYGSRVEFEDAFTDSNGFFTATLIGIRTNKNYIITKKDSSLNFFESNKKGALGDIYL